MKTLTTCSLAAALLLGAGLVCAKLPPVNDDAKAKAAEAAAKAAHGNKVADFQLCKAMDKVAVSYYANAKKAGKDTKPATTTAPCADPGAFVYTPAPPAAPAMPAAAASAATPTVAAAAPPK